MGHVIDTATNLPKRGGGYKTHTEWILKDKIKSDKTSDKPPKRNELMLQDRRFSEPFVFRVCYPLRHRSHGDVGAWLFSIRVYMGMTRGPPPLAQTHGASAL